MKKEAFIKAVRNSGEKFRVDQIQINTGRSQVSGKGTVRVADRQFVLEVTLDDPENVPSSPAWFVCASEFWEVRGTIEEEIEFTAKGRPSSSSRHFGVKTFSTLTFSFGTLDLTPSGFDTLTYAERDAVVRGIQGDGMVAEEKGDPSGNLLAAEGAPATNTRAAVCVLAVLPDFKLVAINGGTLTIERNDFLGEQQAQAGDTFHGQMSDWRFGLIQTGADLHVHLRSTPRYASQSEADDERLIQAFLSGLAFTHGQHAWPRYLEHRREGKVVRNRVTLNAKVARTPHAPFTEAMMFGASDGSGLRQFQQALERSYIFFSQASAIQREVAQVLFVLREASSPGIPQDIALLAVCSLFESLVHAIYADRVAPGAESDGTGFADAKERACTLLKESTLASEAPAQVERICGIVRGAQSLHFRGEFEAVIQALGISAVERWRGVYDLWREFRNAVSHRISKTDDSEESLKETLQAESRIAGAVNCLILRLMGYSGTVKSSSYEDQYMLI